MKNTITRISSILLILPLLFISISCSSDDSNAETNNNNNNTNLHTVEYKISIEEPLLTGIFYRNAEGVMVEATQSLDGTTAWATSVEVEEPFVATVEIIYSSEWAISYAMQIFVDGELKHSSSNIAGGNADIELSYEL